MALWSKKPKPYDLPRRATKMFLPPMKDVHGGLGLLSTREIEIAGVYTVRPSWLRKRQTRNQVVRHGFEPFGVYRIVHTNNNPKEKVRQFLFDTVARQTSDMYGRNLVQSDGKYEPEEGIERAILIDDSYGKIKKAIDELAKEPEMHPLLNKSAFFVFGKEQREVNTGKHFDPAMPSVTPPGIHVKSALSADGKDVLFSVPIIAVPSWMDLPAAMAKLEYFHENHPFKNAA